MHYYCNDRKGQMLYRCLTKSKYALLLLTIQIFAVSAFAQSDSKIRITLGSSFRENVATLSAAPTIDKGVVQASGVLNSGNYSFVNDINQVLILNGSGETVNWSVSVINDTSDPTDYKWIEIDGVSNGTVANNSYQSIKLKINATEANKFTATGTFYKQLLVMAGDVKTTRSAALTILAPPYEVLPYSIEASGEYGSTKFSFKNNAKMSLSNNSDSQVTWAADPIVFDGANTGWLTITPASGTIKAKSSQALASTIVTAKASTFPVGVYTATYTVKFDGGATTVQRVITLTVSRGSTIQLSPTTPLTATMSFGDPAPAFSGNGDVSLTNKTGVDVKWNLAALTYDQPTTGWLKPAVTNGTITAGNASVVNFTLDAATVATMQPNKDSKKPYSATVRLLYFTNDAAATTITQQSINFKFTINTTTNFTATTTAPSAANGDYGQANAILTDGAVVTLTNNTGLENNWTAPVVYNPTVKKGEEWLSFLPTSGTLAHGGTATVNLEVNQANAAKVVAGTHTATITFTLGAVKVPVPVTLTIRPNTAAGSIVMTPDVPTSLSATGIYGSTKFTFTGSVTKYQVENKTGLAVKWTPKIVYNDAGTTGWLTLPAAGGTINAGATVAITPSINAAVAAKAAVNQYSATVSYVYVTQATPPTTQTLTRQLFLNVTPATTLDVEPKAGLTVTGVYNSSSFAFTTNTLKVLNKTGVSADIGTSITGNATWLIAPTTQTLANAATQNFVFSIDNAKANSLPVGTYSATVVFMINGTSSGVTRPVKLTITNDLNNVTVTPTEASPLHATMDIRIKQPVFDAPGSTFTLTNKSGGALKWTVAESPKKSWIASFKPASGTVPAGTPTSPTLQITQVVLDTTALSKLAVGDYTTTVTFVLGTAKVNRLVKVTLTNDPIAPILALAPDGSVILEAKVNDPLPTIAPYRLTQTDGDPCSWTVTADKTWLTFAHTSGTLTKGNFALIEPQFDASTPHSSPGDISAIITVNYSYAGGTNAVGTRTITLRLSTVAPNNTLELDDTQTGSFSKYVTSRQWKLKNTGTSSVNWVVESTVPWLTSVPSTGTLLAGANTAFTLTANPNDPALAGQPAGVYPASIHIYQDLGGGQKVERFTRTVTFSIDGIPTLTNMLVVKGEQEITSLKPNFNNYTGAPSIRVKTYQISNTGTGSLSWAVTATVEYNKDFVTFSLNSGVLEPYEVQTVAVILTDKLCDASPGPYKIQVDFKSLNKNTSERDEFTINVTGTTFASLAVTPTVKELDVLKGIPSEESFDYKLKNVGSEPLDWNINQYEPWLTPAKTSGRLEPGASEYVNITLNGNVGMLLAGRRYADDGLVFEAAGESINRAVTMDVYSTADANSTQDVWTVYE